LFEHIISDAVNKYSIDYQSINQSINQYFILSRKHFDAELLIFYVTTRFSGDNGSTHSELSMGWVDPRVGLGWVGLGREWVENLCF